MHITLPTITQLRRPAWAHMFTASLPLLLALGCNSGSQGASQNPDQQAHTAGGQQAADEPQSAEAGEAPTQSAEAKPTGEGTKVGDGELTKFAKAYVGIMNIQAEYQEKAQAAQTPQDVQALQASMDEEIAEAVEQSGLEPPRFNAIAQEIDQNPSLRGRLEQRLQELQ